jgi:hypothetical protein
MTSWTIWPIAVIALAAIIALFYAVDQCAKFIADLQKTPKNKQRKRSKPVNKMDTILEQHVSIYVCANSFSHSFLRVAVL